MTVGNRGAAALRAAASSAGTQVLCTLVFECRGLQHIRDRYPGLFGHHAETMIQFMWQADLHGVAKFVTDCLGVYYDTDPDRGRASDQP